jgi:hypothetical protein
MVRVMPEVFVHDHITEARVFAARVGTDRLPQARAQALDSYLMSVVHVTSLNGEDVDTATFEQAFATLRGTVPGVAVRPSGFEDAHGRLLLPVSGKPDPRAEVPPVPPAHLEAARLLAAALGANREELDALDLRQERGAPRDVERVYEEQLTVAYERAHRALGRARRLGFADERQRRAFAHLLFAFGPRLDEDEAIAAILRDRDATETQRVERIAMLIDEVLGKADPENGITQGDVMRARFGELEDSSWWHMDEEVPEILREVPSAVRDGVDVLVPVAQLEALLAALRGRHLTPYEAELGSRSKGGFKPLDEEAVDLEPDGGQALLRAIAGGKYKKKWVKVLWSREENG